MDLMFQDNQESEKNVHLNFVNAEFADTNMQHDAYKNNGELRSSKSV